MRKTYKRVLKVFTVSGALGILGGLLTPPRKRPHLVDTPTTRDREEDPRESEPDPGDQSGSSEK